MPKLTIRHPNGRQIDLHYFTCSHRLTNLATNRNVRKSQLEGFRIVEYSQLSKAHLSELRRLYKLVVEK